LVDAHVENLDIAAAITRIMRTGAPDVVGIGYWTPQAPYTYALSDAIRRASPGTVILHGGVHPILLPEESLAHADACLLHESERSLVSFLQVLEDRHAWSTVSGIALIREGELHKQAPAPFIPDLDSIPFPAWDLADMNRYDTPLHVVGGRRLPIIMSRGCPYSCSFCVSPYIWLRTVRWRSAANVVDEMALAIKRYGLNQYHFWDDNLLLDRRRVESLCEEILTRKLRIKWVGLSRASHVVKRRELLPLLRRAGCVGIEVGIESADVEALKVLHKQQTTSEVEEALRLQSEAGMTPLYTLMAFNPGETITGYHLQTEFINRLINRDGGRKLYVGQFCTAYPGTEFYREAPKLGMVLAEGWQDYHHHNIKFLPNSLLDDRPLRRLDRLGWRHRFVVLLESYLWRYDAYPDPRSRGSLLRRFAIEWRALTALFAAADGGHTVRELAGAIAAGTGDDHRESLRIVAFMVMIGGQIGIFASVGAADNVHAREIRFNRRAPNRLYRLLARLDGLTGRKPAARTRA
ncbi:B12-binding domain-containing radical SAM protein, partial [bacterium]|nr:B12-binding domain-containing radical SAM protein [candidate division CSSED10-310 bacterium]